MKTVTAITLCFLSMFIFGGVWNVTLFENAYISLSPEILRPISDFNFGIIFATNAIFTAIIYFVGRHYYDKFKFQSLALGALLGFVSVQPALTNLYAKWDYSFGYLLLDTAYTTLLGALGMLVFCALYFRKPKKITVNSAF